MTTELDALPESVRKAIAYLDGAKLPTEPDWGVVRAELLRYREMVSDRSREVLRLVRESGELKTRAEKAEVRVQELERENGELRSVAEEAELNREGIKIAHKELAAIRQRIAEAVTATVFRLGDVAYLRVAGSLRLIGKTVALLPLDDEAKS